ncbi:major facilitator superfamily protein [Rhodobacteraceae bacterium KLH11]|nr:major facilitator superfamily protein [Rhodobacteraceae bacterium KLH11]
MGFGFLSRLPVGAAGVAIVIAVSASTGSYAIAGSASAVYALFAAILAPVWARIMDRKGQNGVLFRNGLVQFFLYALLAALCHFEANTIPILLSCAAIGFFSLDVGSVVRSRWVFIHPEESKQRTAFMFESAVDEAVFALAPILVTTIAVLQTPYALVLVAMGPLLGWVGLSILAAPRPSEPCGDAPNASTQRLLSKSFISLLAVFVAMGGMLGSIEVVLVASAMEIDMPVNAGFALAGWATGSGLTALFLGMHLSKLRAEVLSILGIAVMTLFTLLLSGNLSLMWQITFCFFAGAGAAPAISSGFSLATRLVPSARVTEALALTSTGLGLGTVAGASSGGFVAEYFSFTQAYYLSVGFGLLAGVISWFNGTLQSES